MKILIYNVTRSLKIAGLIFLLIIPFTLKISAQADRSYSTLASINKDINQLAAQYPGKARIHKLAKTPGGSDMLLIEIGTEIKSDTKKNPAILIVANLEGSRPLASEAALFLSGEVLKTGEHFKSLTWYILPVGSPDAHKRFFSDNQELIVTNLEPYNDDMDDQVDEDPANDLDGNGIITKMRKISPEGTMLKVGSEGRLMRKAEYKDGEKGVYKMYTEGLDDDGDGSYNEDGRGGTNVNANFPHLFEFFKPGTGLYAGSAPEANALIKFAFSHPEIAMTFSFGSTNFLLSPPKGGRQGSVDMEKISIPEEIAEMLGFDPAKTYSMKEIMEKVKPMVPPGMEIDEGMIASFLGLGAVVNPMDADLVFYKKISEDYKKFLKDSGAENERFDPLAAKDGSFELWSYYHLGVPVFSMDLWGLPKLKEEKKESSGITIESLEKMTSDEFVALGEDKINLFLKESGAPEEFKATQVIEMIKGGQFTPEQMAGMMKQMPKPEGGDKKKGDPKEQSLMALADKYYPGKGFVEWKEFNHPDLGLVEVGGFSPYIDINPPPVMIDSILNINVPWIFDLVKYLPRLNISDLKTKNLGEGVYRIELWVSNDGFIPFITEMGKRNKIPVPAIISIEGKNIELLSGKARTPVNELGGMKSTRFTWLVRSAKNQEITFKLESKTAGRVVKQINLGE